MDRGLLRRGLGTVAVFSAGLLVAVLVARSPLAFAEIGGGGGGPTHPTRHFCETHSCDEIALAGTGCPGDPCYSVDFATRFKKCWPVNFEAACNESANNGSEQCAYFCDSITVPVVTTGCGQPVMTFNRCAPVVLGETE